MTVTLKGDADSVFDVGIGAVEAGNYALFQACVAELAERRTKLAQQKCDELKREWQRRGTPRPGRKTSELLRFLEHLTLEELRAVASHRELAESGPRQALVRRIAGDVGPEIDEVVSPAGSFHRDAWNDIIVREFHGQRRRSWEEVREEIRFGLGGAQADVMAMLQDEESTVADVRRDAAVAGRVADVLETSVAKLRNFLEPLHGRTSIAGLAAELARRFQPRRGTEAESESVALASELASNAPSSGAAVSPLTKGIEKPKAGDVLGGRWTIVKELGSGGMGTAFEVKHRRGRVCVAKVAHGDGTETEALVREAELGLELAHENVCRVYELEDDPRFGVFVVMQHCGQSLDQRYRRRSAEVGDAMQLLAEAAAGIDYLHRKSVVHGDVSPANILVDHEQNVRVTDFGIATRMRAVTKTGGLTHVGELHGRNRAFAAPEALSGQELRLSSDQASLAKVFCALLMGVEPFHAAARYTFKRLDSRQAAIDRALHPDPSRRYDTCTAFIKDLMGGMT